RTASLLHIGRQSLYQRLDRIESLLGLDINDPDLLGELLTATCAHRVAMTERHSAYQRTAYRKVTRLVPLNGA
ncbi:helix-turn-helix domain-containing protein, partial [Streptomyces sp. NPDC058307]|uniref:helix-turn-helix domain-containing protein n=1 Tax=Streptomyces sp. NPDC058307 TaxID=3346439 RepID=UPI0036ECD57F